MGFFIDSMFNGRIFLPTKIYWCELNQQIVVRYPVYVRVNSMGLGGYTYKNIRKSMTYIGNLDGCDLDEWDNWEIDQER